MVLKPRAHPFLILFHYFVSRLKDKKDIAIENVGMVRTGNKICQWALMVSLIDIFMIYVNDTLFMYA